MIGHSGPGTEDAADFVFRPARVYKELGFPDYESAAAAWRESYRPRRALWRAAAAVADGFCRLFLRGAECEVLFLGGGRYFDVIGAVARSLPITVVVKGRADRIGCVKRRLPFVAGHDWAIELEAARRREDGAERTWHVERVLESIGAALARLDPAVVVAFGNGPAVNRAVGLAARRQGRPVVSVQHGLYPPWAFSAGGLDGGFSDYWLVWGKHFLRMCVDECGIAPERVFVIGYPYDVRPPDRRSGPRPARRTVCLLGQPWEHLDERLWPAKVDLTRLVQRACAAAGLALLYRPHPREDRDRCRTIDPGLHLTDAGESLADALGRYEVWLGVSSTALIEAALAGNISGQLRSPAFASEAIGRERGVFPVEADAAALAGFFAAIEAGSVAPITVDADYVETAPDRAARLRSILERVRADWGRPAATPVPREALVHG